MLFFYQPIISLKQNQLVIFTYVFYLLTARQIILLRGVAAWEDR